ncbi:hypothetical protein NQ317_014331 [Molorchus minor]|uniref:Uncharacterized protein n=1 Tax=Molorchus minor TaxID=1323400 RepID=A0ABQ9JZJ1_9CUCU|nr:hypothetical protein NQ317_014331 [Molorchus minor]
MSSLSRRDIDDLKPSLDKLVHKIIGTGDSSVLRTTVDCLSSGYDRRKTADKLGSYLDSKKASRLAEKIFDLIDDHRASHRSKKRSHDDDRERDSKRSKTNSRHDNKESDRVRGKPETTEKKMYEPPPSKNNVSIANLTIPPPSIYGIPMGLLNRGMLTKQGR